jgi:4-hydroxybenzoate polyprenyltransferase
LVYDFGRQAAGAPLTAASITQMLLLTMPMNLIGCGLNDLYDIESDRHSSRRRSVWGADVTYADRPSIKRAAWVMATVILLVALLTKNAWNIAATGALVILAWAYSVPQLRLKERPPLDSLSNGLGYFLLPFMVGYSLGARPLAMPSKYWLLALAVCGIHALATAADFAADQAAGQRTFAVVLGRRSAAAFAAATFVIALAFGAFRSGAVDTFLAVGAAASLVATLVPRERAIAVSCTTVYIGFLVAAVCYLAGL